MPFHVRALRLCGRGFNFFSLVAHDTAQTAEPPGGLRGELTHIL